MKEYRRTTFVRDSFGNITDAYTEYDGDSQGSSGDVGIDFGKGIVNFITWIPIQAPLTLIGIFLDMEFNITSKIGSNVVLPATFIISILIHILIRKTIKKIRKRWRDRKFYQHIH